MVYQLIIPAQFAPGVAAGTISLMTTTAGATTTLVAGGQIVGVATLAEVGGSTAVVGATAGAGGGAGVAAGGGAVAASSVLWPIAIGVAGVALIGFGLWWLLRDNEPETVEADTAVIEFEATPEEAEEVLRKAQAIVDAEYGRAVDAPRVEMEEI